MIQLNSVSLLWIKPYVLLLSEYKYFRRMPIFTRQSCHSRPRNKIIYCHFRLDLSSLSNWIDAPIQTCDIMNYFQFIFKSFKIFKNTGGPSWSNWEAALKTPVRWKRNSARRYEKPYMGKGYPVCTLWEFRFPTTRIIFNIFLYKGKNIE